MNVDKFNLIIIILKKTLLLIQKKLHFLKNILDLT